MDENQGWEEVAQIGHNRVSPYNNLAFTADCNCTLPISSIDVSQHDLITDKSVKHIDRSTQKKTDGRKELGIRVLAKCCWKVELRKLEDPNSQIWGDLVGWISPFSLFRPSRYFGTDRMHPLLIGTIIFFTLGFIATIVVLALYKGKKMSRVSAE